ncbi:hypothetical protein B0J13DRAFT_648007 [Dactylonectria estremocensis]|uniref:Uncharacterized protein n=1 Tax=Dactylonectria estremocensis TaxID=1079267 RepID=A0A9P9DR06_9HYPO|nr:hypothetical protein B0J13DRAFT_648007 [Dactylonectria estremocensis]
MDRVFSLLAFSGALASAAADTVTQTNVLIHPPGYWYWELDPMDASVVDVDSAKTTYALRCPADDTTRLKCDKNKDQLFTYGPTTMEFATVYNPETMVAQFGFDTTFTYHVLCGLISEENNATCTVTMRGEMSGSMTEKIHDTVWTTYLDNDLVFAVTAGASKLPDWDTATPGASITDTEAAATASSLASSTVSKQADSTFASSSSHASPASAVSSTGTEPGSTNSEATPTASNTGNAAGPVMTQNAALIGIAVVGGAAMLL